MNSIRFAVASLMLATAACSAESASDPEPTKSTESHLDGADNGVQVMEIDDLDEDGVKDTLSTTENFFAGNNHWQVHLSSLGDAGEIFARFISPLPKGTQDQAASFFAWQRGGECEGSFVKYEYSGGAYQATSSIDCHEVTHRPEGAPIAQFEYQCFNVVPPTCP